MMTRLPKRQAKRVLPLLLPPLRLVKIPRLLRLLPLLVL
jgi:hypothetical protein